MFIARVTIFVDDFVKVGTIEAFVAADGCLAMEPEFAQQFYSKQAADEAAAAAMDRLSAARAEATG